MTDKWTGWYWKDEQWHRGAVGPDLAGTSALLNGVLRELGLPDKDSLLNHGGCPLEPPLWRQPFRPAAG